MKTEENKKPSNPHAFPCVVPGDEKKGWDAEVLEGMTLRDYFAAKAMNGWIVNAHRGIEVESVARNAYLIADAMLKERENVQ